jgi:hypothetical protein
MFQIVLMQNSVGDIGVVYLENKSIFLSNPSLAHENHDAGFQVGPLNGFLFLVISNEAEAERWANLWYAWLDLPCF